MRVSRAKRRWIRWCRYVDQTQTQTGPSKHWGGFHQGQANAYADYMFAKRYVPRGARWVWYPEWGNVR